MCRGRMAFLNRCRCVTTGMFRRARADFDETMITWADRLDPAWLVSDITWFSATAKREITKPKWILVTHMFNHQTHHRG